MYAINRHVLNIQLSFLLWNFKTILFGIKFLDQPRLTCLSLYSLLQASISIGARICLIRWIIMELKKKFPSMLLVGKKLFGQWLKKIGNRTEIRIMLARPLTYMFTINPLIGYSSEMSLTANLLTNIVKINPIHTMWSAQIKIPLTHKLHVRMNLTMQRREYN